MKLILFLRSIVWTSVLSLLLIVASTISALLSAPLTLTLPLGLAAIASAVLSTQAD